MKGGNGGSYGGYGSSSCNGSNGGEGSECSKGKSWEGEIKILLSIISDVIGHGREVTPSNLNFISKKEMNVYLLQNTNNCHKKYLL